MSEDLSKGASLDKTSTASVGGLTEYEKGAKVFVWSEAKNTAVEGMVIEVGPGDQRTVNCEVTGEITRATTSSMASSLSEITARQEIYRQRARAIELESEVVGSGSETMSRDLFNAITDAILFPFEARWLAGQEEEDRGWLTQHQENAPQQDGEFVETAKWSDQEMPDKNDSQ